MLSLKPARPGHADAELLADRAAVAVGGDHVSGADRAGLAAVDIAHLRGDAGLVLLEIDQLAAVVQLRAELGRAAVEQRLEALLGHEEPPARAVGLEPGVDARHEQRQLAPGEQFDQVDAAVGAELLVAGLEDRRLEPDPAIGLHRADVEIARARVDRGAGVLLDDLRGDPVMPEERRRREPDQAAADDQHVAFGGAGHGVLLFPRGILWASAPVARAPPPAPSAFRTPGTRKMGLGYNR